jgi:hypothetical protein
MRPGESGHITFTDLYVSKDGDCYLTADARLREKSGSSTVEVRRADDGYHVIIDAQTKYTPGRISIPREKLPVASITVTQGER